MRGWMMPGPGKLVLPVFSLMLLAAGAVYGRGEGWVPKPPAPPPVSTLTNEDRYIEWKFREDVTDPSTGENAARLTESLKRICDEGLTNGTSWRIVKAQCLAYEMRHEAIDVSPLDWFPAFAVWNRYDEPIRKACVWPHCRLVNGQMLSKELIARWQQGNAEGDWNMWQDFDHSVPDWRVIMELGFPGMRERLLRYAENGRSEFADGSAKDPYYAGLELVADAMLAELDRLIAQGERKIGGLEVGKLGSSEVGKFGSLEGRKNRLVKQVESFRRLKAGPPKTALDAMMFIYLYFYWSEHLEGIQCRSLTELDVFLTPFYDADLAAGRTTEAEFRDQLKHFLWQWGSIDNYWNQPAGLGGTRADGSSEYNHVSKIILEVIDECNLTTPKFLVKIAPNTPDWAFDKMLDMARRHRSIAFIGEEPAARALKKWSHASDEECRKMVCRGCYEFGLRDSVNGTGVGHVNFLKVVEKMLKEQVGVEGRGGKTDEWKTWEEFKAEYVRRLKDVTARCRDVAFEFEKVLPYANPANLMSLSTEHALRTGRDGFANGCPNGNASGILAVGPGTAVDALLAVKELVYENEELRMKNEECRKEHLSLKDLGEIMAKNWEGHEELRLRMLRSKRKWGNNDPEANALGAEIIAAFAGELNGRPNSKGGEFRASGHSARQYIVLGAKTGATPDGRKAGEEMSKNVSPTMGADTEGATALVETMASSDVTVLPGDYPLDMMLHPSVCSGAKGLEVMKTLVKRFHRNGGSVIQFTVFSADELREAQKHPEKYENLQVRVCGWNTRWNDLPKAEQDAYILRAERIMQ